MDFEVTEAPEPLAGLIREHRSTEELLARVRKAAGAATAIERDESLVAHALEELQGLNAFLAIELTVHIAKEEDVLFPALLDMADGPVVITDMLAQHEEVRAKEDALRLVLDSLEATHADLDAAKADLAATLSDATGEISGETLMKLRDIVTKLDWILQGHFGDEERGLFEPAAEWLSPGRLDELADGMARLEAEYA